MIVSDKNRIRPEMIREIPWFFSTTSLNLQAISLEYVDSALSPLQIEVR